MVLDMCADGLTRQWRLLSRRDLFCNADMTMMQGCSIDARIMLEIVHMLDDVVSFGFDEPQSDLDCGAAD